MQITYPITLGCCFLNIRAALVDDCTTSGLDWLMFCSQNKGFTRQRHEVSPSQPAHRSVKGQNEAPLGIIFCGSAVTPVPSALQVLKAVVGVVQHGCLLTRLLSVGTPQREHAAICDVHSGVSACWLTRLGCRHTW